MGAAVLRHKLAEAGLADRVTVSSAGTGDWHVGGPADKRARAALRKRGYDDTHTARQFVRADFGEHDLVLGMDAANIRDLRRIAPNEDVEIRLFDTIDVPDPYYGDARHFDEALDQIERAADVLIADLRAQLRS
jgi:protein-tyrosine phosphatase